MEITDRAKKIVASSVAGLGVLGTLVGFGVKGLGEADAQQVEEAQQVADDLQQNSEELLALAEEMEGEEAQEALEMGEYIGQVADKMAEGELPTEEELQEAQEKLNESSLGGGESADSGGGNSGGGSDSSGDDSGGGSGGGSSGSGSSGSSGGGSGSGSRSSSGGEKDSSPSSQQSASSSTPSRESASDSNSDQDSGSSSGNERSSSSPSGSSSGSSSGSGGGSSSGSTGSSRGGGSQNDDSDSKQGVEEMSADVEAINEQIEAITATIGEINGLFDEVNEESDNEVEELNETGEMLDEMLESLTEAFSENETEIDTQQEEAITQLDDFQEVIGELLADLTEVQETALEMPPEIATELKNEQQSLENNSQKIELIIKQIVEGEDEDSIQADIDNLQTVSDNSGASTSTGETSTGETRTNTAPMPTITIVAGGDSGEEVTIRIPKNLDAVTAKMEASFTPFQQLINQINQQLNTEITNTENNFNSLTQLLTDSDNQLSELVNNWLEDLQDNQQAKIVDNSTKFREELVNKNKEFIQTNQDLLNKFESDCESCITAMENQLENKAQSLLAEEAEKLEKSLAELQKQAEDNADLIKDQENILTQVDTISEQLIDTDEIVERMNTQLDGLAV